MRLKILNTLIIHPKDSSTVFLSPIYKDIPNKILINGGVSKETIIKSLPNYHRIMMMGHGSPRGLFGTPFNCPYIVDHQWVDELKKRDNNFFLWCNADMFVKGYSLRGFFSGMFISEVGEAQYCLGLRNVPQKLVDESNFEFVRITGQYVNSSNKELYLNVKKEYNEVAKKNPIAKYNWERLYIR